MNGLTPKQKAFADNYIENGGNAEKAAVNAGYSRGYARGNAHKLVANSCISAYIAERQKQIDSQRIATLKEIQEMRTAIARGEKKDDLGFAPDAATQLKAMDAIEKALRIKEEQEEKQKAIEAARSAAPYHTDLDIIADTFHPIVRSMRRKEFNEYDFIGGRGSAKSSCGTIIPFEIMKNYPNVHAIALRQVANTLRDSIYAQFQWSVEMQAENPMFDRDNWEFKLSPLEITYRPTGQKIYFRGADDPGKIKSIKVPFGYIGIIIWEEFDQFQGEEAVRKIEQSVIRGGDFVWNIKIMNPPISIHNWANNYMNVPKVGKIVHKSTYKDLPPEWIGKAFIEEAEHLKEVNPAAYEHEYMGEPIGLGTEIFKFLEIREITDDEVKAQEKIFQGQDWGWEPDPKAFIRCSYIHATEKVMLLDEMGGTCIRTKDMAQMIKDAGYDDYSICCGADEQEHITDFRDAGLPARQALVGPGSVRRTFEWLQCRTIVIDPARTPRAYKEFTKYEHEVDKNGDVIDGYPDHDNHWIDAVRYATSPLSMRRGNSA